MSRPVQHSWVSDGPGFRCEHCGLRSAIEFAAHCTPYTPHGKSASETSLPGEQIAANSDFRLGDWVEAQFKSMGVTEERYKEVKQKFHLPPTCDCQARKEWLNRVSDWWAGRAQGD